MANEKRLIDANALKDDFRRYMADRFDRERCVSEENCITCGRVCLFQRTINNAPTVDAVEVVHGYWVSLTECANAGVYCSVCNKKVYKEDYAWCNRKNKLRSNYCPNCGAKMDGDGNG